MMPTESQHTSDGYTRRVTTIIDEELLHATYAPEYNTWLLWPGYYDYDSESEVKGTLQLLRPDGSRIALPGIEPSDTRYFQWSAADDAFLFKSGDTFYQVTVDGRITEFGPTMTATPFTFAAYPGNRDPIRLVSPDGTLWAWRPDIYESIYGLWVGAPNSEPDEIGSGENFGDYWAEDGDLLISYADWSPDSQRLILLTNQGLYIAERPDFDLAQITSEGIHPNYFDKTLEWLP
jgi:hypothetical protein